MGTCARFAEDNGRYLQEVIKVADANRCQCEYVFLDGNDTIYQWFKRYANGQNLAKDKGDFTIAVPKDVLQELLNKLEECQRLVRQTIRDCLGIDPQCDEAYDHDIVTPIRGIKELLEEFDWQNKTLYYDWSPT